MQTRRTPLGGILGGLLLALVAVTSVAAYSAQVTATVVVSGPSGPQACNTPITITAQVQDVSGNLIAGQPVQWSMVSGNITGDTILDTTTTSNASGIASTQVQFACTPHSVTFGVLADQASGTLVLSVSGQGLPRTDTAPETSTLAMMLAALAVLIGSGTILRRFAVDRR